MLATWSIDKFLQEPLQLVATNGMLQFAYCLGLDLPYPLPGNLEDTAHFLKRVGISIPEAIAKPDDFPLTVSECLKQGFNSLTEDTIICF